MKISSAASIAIASIGFLALVGLTQAAFPTDHDGHEGGTLALVHFLEQNGISADKIENVSMERFIVVQDKHS